MERGREGRGRILARGGGEKEERSDGFSAIITIHVLATDDTVFLFILVHMGKNIKINR